MCKSSIYTRFSPCTKLKKIRHSIKILPFIIIAASCHIESEIPIEIDVVFHVRENNYTSPLIVGIENLSRGANEYKWTFEGGSPSSSSEISPSLVSFSSPGEHTITLEAWNEGLRVFRSFHVHVDSAVVSSFMASPEINNYSPALFYITNLSSGGSTYKWTFTGGAPSSYEGISPPPIRYESEGSYPITLTVWNGSAIFISTLEIQVRESLNASFTLTPSFEDEDDMEAPLRASLSSRLQGVETVFWSCEGGILTDPESPKSDLYIPSPGTYTVYLEVSNGKQTLKLSQDLTVNENTNLRTHENILFGINSSHDNYSPYYSTKLRKNLRLKEIDETNGSMIDIVFYGLNTNFTYNMFVSPALLSETSLPEIPHPLTTHFINKMESGSIKLSESQFKSMTTDIPLRSLPISSASYGYEFFSGTPLPRVVLFETSDNRKGAILVKEFISNGKERSYIIADIKIQKND